MATTTGSQRVDEVIRFGDLKRQYHELKDSIDGAIDGVLASGWFVLGERVDSFEKSFANYCDIGHAVGVGSGVDALHIALVASGVGKGDEVITVANTCVPTLSAISLAGAHPVLVDVEPDTLTMDPQKIESRITDRTRAIIPVHLYGQCVSMGPIMELATRYSLRVIEDCAQAHGATCDGAMAGTMGDAGCYSFYPSKNLGAYGDGGMVVTRDPDLAEACRRLRNYGQSRRYHHEGKGFNSRLDELQAAVLECKLPHLDRWNERRRQIAQYYVERLEGSGVVCPHEGVGRRHVYHLFVIRVQGREGFQRKMDDAGVQTLIHYPVPIHRQAAYAETLPQGPYLEVTDQLAPEIVSLPIYPELKDFEVEQVAEAVLRATVEH